MDPKKYVSYSQKVQKLKSSQKMLMELKKRYEKMSDERHKIFFNTLLKCSKLYKEYSKTRSELNKLKTELGMGVSGFTQEIQKARMYSIKKLLDKFSKETGRDFYCCPIHREKKPSLKIYPDTNSWYCFGCNEGRNPIDFVMKVKDIRFVEAVKFINELE